jgi:chromosome condensin MukBEF MukE localization factor
MREPLLFSSSILSTDADGDDVDQQDVERIARASLKELGVFGVVLTVAADGAPGHWRIDIQGGHGPARLKIRCGEGSSAQWVRDQIFEQYHAQS